jgi:hypothetical protein
MRVAAFCVFRLHTGESTHPEASHWQEARRQASLHPLAKAEKRLSPFSL